MLTRRPHKSGLRRIAFTKRVDPIVEQVRKVMGTADQRLILMVRG